MQRKHVAQITLSILMLIIIAFSIFTIGELNKIKDLNEQIENLKDKIEHLEQEKEVKYVILTYIDKDKKEVKSYLVDKDINISIYDFLLTTKDFSLEDFDSWDQVNYYFKGSKTDVLELMENTDYYEIGEYTTLVVGLQAIKMKENYTVIKSSW